MIHDELHSPPATTARDDAERVHGQPSSQVRPGWSATLDLQQRADQVLRRARDERRPAIGGVLAIPRHGPHEQEADHVNGTVIQKSRMYESFARESSACQKADIAIAGPLTKVMTAPSRFATCANS